MTDVHPDFLATPVAKRWTGELAELFPFLRTKAMLTPAVPVWRILPGGALVSVTYEEGMKDRTSPEWKLRLARKKAPTTDEGWSAWAKEVQVFLKQFGGPQDWKAIEFEGSGTECDARFKWVKREKRGPGDGNCARCGKPTPHEPEYAEDLCQSCAIKAGQETTDLLTTARATRKPK